MALPPFEAGAVHETTASLPPGFAETAVGAPGTVIGVTLADGADAALVPAAFAAVTVNVYAVPLVRPVIVALVAGAATLTDKPPGAAVTVYPVIALPPLDAGAVHDTVAWALPAVA